MSIQNDIRDAILAAPFELDNTGEKPSLSTLYVPQAHRKALSRDSVLVVGARGVGKSFWTSALSDNQLRNQIGESVQDLNNAIVFVGHAAKPKIANYPDRDTFKSLIQAQYEPYAIWRAVIARWLGSMIHYILPIESWKATVTWVESNPEGFAKIVEAASTELERNNQFGLIVFDALDRTSRDWSTMNLIVKDLLQIALWLRDFPRLRAKIFLRPDQLDRSTTFVDASKLIATKAELTWERHDLHAMLWQRLINAADNHGVNLRALATQVLPPLDPLKESENAWYLPSSLKSEQPYQRRLFELLAGDKMGKDARRGVPYVWSVSHLADGHGWTSPRSFLAAIYGAAEDSRRRYEDYALALHYESLKRGIQKASQIRVDQVAEDDPWVKSAMLPLTGMNVPCDYEAMKQEWSRQFPSGPSSISTDLLPPQHVDNWDGIKKDLERLGIFVTRKDGRIDMPDLYRVGFSLGRKGGVVPKR